MLKYSVLMFPDKKIPFKSEALGSRQDFILDISYIANCMTISFLANISHVKLEIFPTHKIFLEIFNIVMNFAMYDGIVVFYIKKQNVYSPPNNQFV